MVSSENYKFKYQYIVFAIHECDSVIDTRVVKEKEILCCVDCYGWGIREFFFHHSLHSKQRDQLSDEMIWIQCAQFVVDIFKTWSFKSWVRLSIDEIGNDLYIYHCELMEILKLVIKEKIKKQNTCSIKMNIFKWSTHTIWTRIENWKSYQWKCHYCRFI